MKFLSPCAAAVLACIPWWALAQEPAPQWLPPPDQVHATLQAQPTVRAAAERLQAAAATQRALEVGSHEFQANSGLQRRNVTTEAAPLQRMGNPAQPCCSLAKQGASGSGDRQPHPQRGRYAP